MNRIATLSHSILATALTVTLTGCVVAPENESGESGDHTKNPDEDSPEGQNNEHGFIETSYTTSTELGVNLEIGVRPLELIEEKSLKLSMEVSNSSGKDYAIEDALSDPENPYSASATTLIDPATQSRHLNNELEDGSCYCTFTQGVLESGDSINLEVMFPPPPEGTDFMTVTTPVTSPFFDVPIIESSESAEEDYTEGEILSLTMISNDEGNSGWSEQENDEELSILLSSDVLFDFDSAELTSEADEIIEQVASEIDQSNSSTVAIKGYTDDQGSDSVNIPLSEERAESVETSLSDIITRDDVKFETEGHGSSDPVADNRTDEGRELNRRVTVTFEK
ncbi:hypothetical protein GCM10007147_15160 [Nocardiopsis kunsanensis]|uniref:OmpA-like domain-containing protein n=1 Tax=Nocardiopsis kunsanensis TaxID=141693 RepID=A0A918XAC5_9ACTN|nr:OmpA family protein [Nocardiopsis kunsanensis]GHD21585.1 hypothetical protein GCM10007147_15160 [Nocardiopsis kunsanensis]